VVGRHNDPYLLGLEVLSPRERQVFELLSESFGNKELMESLNISLPTVKQYKSEVSSAHTPIAIRGHAQTELSYQNLLPNEVTPI